MKAFSIVGIEDTKRGIAQPHRLFEHSVEHRREITRRGIDDLQHLCRGGLLLQCFVALGKGLVEPLLQLSVGTPKICYFVIERRGHLHLPSRPAPDRIIPRQPPIEEKGVRLDHLLVESVKSAFKFRRSLPLIWSKRTL